MATLAKHSVPGTPVTIYIQQLVRGFTVVSMGDPSLQRSKKATTEEKAREIANEMYAAAKAKRDGKVVPAAPASKPVPQITAAEQAQFDADERAMNDMVAAAETAADRAVAAFKASLW